MPELTWAHGADVAADPDAVFAWMSDFREDDHHTEAFLRGSGAKKRPARPAKRRILSHVDDVVTLEDEWGRNRFRVRVEVDAARREVRLRGDHGYEATWRATPDGRGGTRFEVTGRMAPGGLFGLLLPLFGRGMRTQLEQDFRGHLEDLRETVAAAAKEA